MQNSQIELQRKTIEKTLTVLRNYDSVDGVFLTGSHAVNQNTVFSDIDLCILFKTEERENLKEIHKKIGNIFPALSILYLYDKDGLFLFENGVRLDISYIKLSEFKNINLKKAKILIDNSGLVAIQIDKTKNLTEKADLPKWNKEEGEFIDWFFWMFRQIYCWAKQAEKNSEKSFEKLYSAQTSLQLVRNKIIEMRIYINGNTDYLNNIDKKLADKLNSTFVVMNSKDIIEATINLFKIFEEVGKNFCNKTNTKFPSEKAAVMKKLFKLFDSN